MAAAKTLDQKMDESLALAVEYLPLVVSGLARCRESGAKPSATTADIILSLDKLPGCARGLVAAICQADGGETLRSVLAVRPPNEPEKPAVVHPDIPPRVFLRPPTGTVFNQTRDGFRHGWWKRLRLRESAHQSNIKWIGRYEDGERVGYWEETSEDGDLLYGFYVDGKKDGEWVQCHKDSVTVAVYTKGHFGSSNWVRLSGN